MPDTIIIAKIETTEIEAVIDETVLEVDVSTTTAHTITSHTDVEDATGEDGEVLMADGTGNYSWELDCPRYLYIAATGQSENTDLHLTDGTNWNVSKALIGAIRVETSSTDWDAWLMFNDNGKDAGDSTIPQMQIMEQGYGNQNILLNLPYNDEDASNEVHLYFTDNSGNNTFDVYIIGYQLK